MQIPPPYCDYCGETIHNWHKMKRGEDIDLAINARIIEGMLKRTKSTILRWLIAIGTILSLFTIKRNLCFCNQKHKDLFAKRIGLKTKPTIK